MALAGPSKRHWKLEPISSAVKLTEVELALIVPLGPEVMVVTGATVSTLWGSPQVVPPSMR